MIAEELEGALATLTAAVRARPALFGALHAYWRAIEAPPMELGGEVRAAADFLDAKLPELTQHEDGRSALARLLGEPAGQIVLTWCAAGAARSDARMAELLKTAAEKDASRDFAIAAARDRIVEGPLLDALACVPLLGTGDVLALPENAEASARIEILIWEAGASAIAAPDLGRWIWASPKTFEAVIGLPAHGSLRARVLAARCLEIAVGGMSPATDPQLVGRTLQVLQPLLLHPEPLVWVHAARALGRLT
ncbi:MAG TPA: hypothetical protein VIL20_13480, partial [Sandaracinaceae bacterium]